MTDIHLASGYIPGAIGRITELHGVYYHHHWRFGRYFEVKVATELAAFMDRYDGDRDGFWTVSQCGRIEGAIVIDAIHAESEGAHLRWFILSDALRGIGAGHRLLTAAMACCRKRNYPAVYLWTFEGLHAARHLYEQYGFRLVDQRAGEGWGVRVNEQRFQHGGISPERGGRHEDES